MNSLQIQYFLSVARTSSFSKAAQINYTSQPSVSRQIVALEKELGFTLFNRDTHSVVLTDSGQLLYKELNYLVDRIKGIIETARRSAVNVTHLHIGYLKETNTSIISPFIQSFSRYHPQIALEFEGYKFRELWTELIAGSVDVAFLLSFDTKDSPFISQRKVFCSREHFMFSANHPLAAKPNLCISDFFNECLVVAEESSNGAAFAISQCKSCGFSPKEIHTSVTSEAIDLYIESQSCISIMDTTNRLFSDPRFRFFEIPGEQAKVSLNAVWRTDNTNSAISLFCDVLPEELEE